MKLHFRKLGEGGRPLVILHGLFGSSDNWQTLARKFAEDFTVYLVDFRNHGHSPWSKEFSYRILADDVHELFVDESISDAILVGHSMGGKAAMLFAQLYPELLHGLVVVDMGVKAYSPRHTRILEGLNAINLGQVKSRGEAERILADYVDSVGVLRFLLKNLYWVEKGQLGWRINIEVLEREMPEILSALPEGVVEIPTLFIDGETSDYIHEDDHYDIIRQFPKGMIETIEGAGHWVHAEAPAMFYQAIMDFA